jgi:hypothetical protein
LNAANVLPLQWPLGHRFRSPQLIYKSAAKDRTPQIITVLPPRTRRGLRSTPVGA